MSPLRLAARLGTAAATLALLAACAVGPNFLRPAAPGVAGYTEGRLPPGTAASPVQGGAAQHFMTGADIPGEWWQLFHSPPLNALIMRALRANPSLQAAQATLRQARETLYAGQGAFLPSVNGTTSIEREKESGAAFGIPGLSGLFSISTAQVSVSYPLDVFGGTRRQVESLAAQVTYQRFELEAAYLTLTSNVVNAAVQEASVRAQLAATQDIITAESRELGVLQRQFTLGGVAKAAVLAQQATVAQARASLVPLQKQQSQLRHQLADLAGAFPSEGAGATFDLAALTLPQNLPVSLPSKLVEQRPDVQAAAAQLHAASAQVGVATANQLPQLTLSGAYGSQAAPAAGLFGPGTAVWNIAAGLTGPLFHGGTLLHQKRAAVAAFDASAAQYRGVVLGAFQNVADALRALEADANALKAQLAAERAAADSLAIARVQYTAGGVNYLALLQAEQTYQQAHISLVQAQASRFADTAALFQALGGGWWHRSDAAAPNDAPFWPLH